MFHVVLYEPEIPPNTGNIIRLCANTGTRLHLIQPLGFTMDDRQLKRAGLDYHEYTRINEYNSYSDFMETAHPGRIFAVSTRGNGNYAETDFQPGDHFIFGPETRGLPAAVMTAVPAARILRIPMQDSSRSLNLSNAVAVILYEALRQHQFRFA